MNNNLQTMMEQMMEKMMEQMMMKTMENMFSSMMQPTVATAQVTEEPKQQVLTREQFLAMQETTQEVQETDLEPIELVVYDNKGLKFNRQVSKDIWTINYITLKSKYPNVKYDKSVKGFRWNRVDTNEFRVACRDYQVITEITPKIKKELENYYREKAQKRAEYYASLVK